MHEKTGSGKFPIGGSVPILSNSMLNNEESKFVIWLQTSNIISI